MASPIFQLLLTDSDSAGCNYAAETSLLVWMLQQGEAADCSKAWSFAAFLRVMLQTVMLVTATTVVDDVDDSRVHSGCGFGLGFQKSSMKRWSNLKNLPFEEIHSRYLRSVKRLLDAHGVSTFVGDAVPGEDVYDVTADGLARSRVIVAFCSENYGGSSSRDLHWRVFWCDFYGCMIQCMGQIMALLQKRGGKKDGITWNPWKLPRLNDLKNKFFFYKLHFHVPEVRISSPKAQKLSLLQRGLYQKMSCMKHLETASILANRTEPFSYLQFLVEVWI